MKDFMKKDHFFTYSKMCVLALTGASTLMLASCAKDGYDDESFDAGVTNTQLASPSADDITITPSADGKSQTITWPVVVGAGGYLVNLIDLSNPAEPIINDSIVDGCSVTGSREEDVNYQLTILTLANDKKHNNAASESTTKLFSTFTAAYATIPNGTDLVKYFAENPVPDSEDAVYYDLEPGGSYVLSDVLDFQTHNVVLRTTSNTDYATVVYEEKGSIEYCGGLTLKYLNLNCTASSKPVLAFSANPPADILDADNNNHNQITEPTTIQNCNIYGVKGMLLYDNKVKYCLKTFLMENTLLHLESEKMSNGSVIYVYDGGGFINDLTMTNCTVWNTGESDQKYFIRYNNSGRCDRAGYTSNSINLYNCTMYKIASSGQMCNHGGFDGRKTSNYSVKNNIFVDCGNKQVPRRIIGRQNEEASIEFLNNTYCTYVDGVATFELEGAPDSVEGAKMEYDNSHTALQTDPAFVDPANGDFTPTGAQQVSLKTGDQRWFND